MVFVGPSGCGKTTALRMVAGLEEISEGAILIGDRIVNEISPKDRDVAMVFQNYALYPHMTVAQNLAFGLKLRKLGKAEIARRVQAAAAALDLEEHLERKPRALSGGQRQRVALGRAIVREPAAFLMDEPLSNLDAALRAQTRAEILKLQKHLRTTTIYVTHDQVEAMTMGDRIAVMKKGVLQQIGTPEELYTRPANVFVATFIGSPSMNVVPAAAIGIGGDGQLAGFRPEHIRSAPRDAARSASRRRSRSSNTSATSSSPTSGSASTHSSPSSRSNRASPTARERRSPCPLAASHSSTRRPAKQSKPAPYPRAPVRIPTKSQGQPARSTPRGTDSRTRFTCSSPARRAFPAGAANGAVPPARPARAPRGRGSGRRRGGRARRWP